VEVQKTIKVLIMVVGKILAFAWDNIGKVSTMLMPDFFQLFYTAFVLFCLYSATWMLSAKMHDVTLVNFLWGISFSLQAVIYFYKSLEYTIFSFFSDKFSWEKLTFTILIFAHGIRLSSYLILREMGKGEDPRWARLRERFGGHFWWLSYFVVFMPAMIANLLVGSMIYAFANAERKNIGHVSYWGGIGLMLFGGVLGALADIQRYTFRMSRRNEGKIMDQGLWRISRHPNYLGEVLFWWGVYLVNFSAGILWTIFAPIMLTFMILFVTGIPVNEKSLRDQHGQDYIDYAKRVPIFIPFFGAKSVKGSDITDKGLQSDQSANRQQQSSFSQTQGEIRDRGTVGAR
jgi:steroid 5-alpha reductase family enzyme